MDILRFPFLEKGLSFRLLLRLAEELSLLALTGLLDALIFERAELADADLLLGTLEWSYKEGTRLQRFCSEWV